MKFSDSIASNLVELGYTKCFSLGGGNIMHLVESLSKKMEIIPVLHEVSACIAAEHFNELSPDEKALVLVTTGPGLTNCVTAIASCFLESRELLVIGGQVKTSDLTFGDLRQIGIQEVQGTKIVDPITKLSTRLLTPISAEKLASLASETWTGRKGPVFIEIPLDVQAIEVKSTIPQFTTPRGRPKFAGNSEVLEVSSMISNSSRPIFLLGGGLDYRAARKMAIDLEMLGIPIMTSWNGADRFDNNSQLFFGRPNTWGQRFSNVILQQADLVVSIGTRLGLQQTGFNWEEFAPLARIVQVDLDELELNKGRPKIEVPINADAEDFLWRLIQQLRDTNYKSADVLTEWIQFCGEVKSLLPISESVNSTHPGYWNPYDFYVELSSALDENDVLLPGSSGSSFTTAYQAIQIKPGTRILSSKALASMGYGLGAALGVAHVRGKRPILVEGDGGFAQNLQDLGTLFHSQPSSKVFIWDNGGYASIRKTQQSYFNGHYVGCDTDTGLILPD
jgi:acetolactate synthase-1/2/3 large subunit